MNDRLSIDEISSDQLDALYDQRDRVTELYEQWVKSGAPPLGTPIARWWDRRLVELHKAIAPPTEQAAPPPGPCPACRRADQAGLAPDEQHPECAPQEQPDMPS